MHFPTTQTDWMSKPTSIQTKNENNIRFCVELHRQTLEVFKMQWKNDFETERVFCKDLGENEWISLMWTYRAVRVWLYDVDADNVTTELLLSLYLNWWSTPMLYVSVWRMTDHWDDIESSLSTTTYDKIERGTKNESNRQNLWVNDGNPSGIHKFERTEGNCSRIAEERDFSWNKRENNNLFTIHVRFWGLWSSATEVVLL